MIAATSTAFSMGTLNQNPYFASALVLIGMLSTMFIYLFTRLKSRGALMPDLRVPL